MQSLEMSSGEWPGFEARLSWGRVVCSPQKLSPTFKFDDSWVERNLVMDSCMQELNWKLTALLY